MEQSWWKRLWNTLRNERGQIPNPVEPAPAEPEPAEPAPVPPEPAPEPAGDQGAPQDTFFDPKALPPELQQTWKKMQGAYTRKLQQFAQGRDALELVQRFNTDPAFRRATLQQYAHELGIQGQAPQPTGTPQQQAPQEFVQAFKQALPAELQWMADSQANAFWQANQLAMAPVYERMNAQTIEDRSSQWDDLATQLPPGWEEHEDEMADLLDFLESPALRHPTYGSKLGLLYQLATGEATAVTGAIERMGAAAQNRVSSSGSGRQVRGNLAERIMKTRPGSAGLREAVQMAGRAAMEELEAKGARFD